MNTKIIIPLLALTVIFSFVITQAFAQESSQLKKYLYNTSPIYRTEDAPITIIEYSDFMDGFSKKWMDETRPELEIFVKSDLVKFYHKPMSIIGERSDLAIKAVQCAGNQDRYWTFHDRLFDSQYLADEEYDVYFMINLAGRMGMDKLQFMDCILNDKTVVSSRDGFSGSPQFVIINSDEKFVIVQGAQDIKHFVNTIKLFLGVYEQSPDDKQYWINHNNELVYVYPSSAKKLVERGYLLSKL